MSAIKRPRYADQVSELSLPDVLELSKAQLANLIENESTHPYTRATWKVLLRILNHSFRTKSTIEFWGDHLQQIFKFVKMSANTQTLFLRLFARTGKWHMCNRIGDAVIKPKLLVPSVNELAENGFAHMGDNIDLDSLLGFLLLDDLKKLCKGIKIEHKLPKDKLVTNIKKYAQTQRSIFDGGDMESRIIKVALSIVGDCFCLDESFCTLLLAVMTVYCPVTMDSKNFYDKKSRILQADFFYTYQLFETEMLINHVEPDLVKRISIYQDVKQLFEYVEAKEIEKKIIRSDVQTAADMTNDITFRLLVFIAASTDEHDQLIEYYANLPDCLLRYTAPWVYVRCLYLCAETYQKLKDYTKAIEIFLFLLNQNCLKRFRVDERGYLYVRIALNLHSHLKNKESALMYCELGLADDLVPQKFQLALQERAKTLSKEFKLLIELEEWETVTIVANTLRKNIGGTRKNVFIAPNSDTGGFDHCSVEEVALRHFLSNGYTEGFHSEGRAWHMLYFLIFFDIIFDINVENAWISEFQRDPLDRNTKAFFTNRQAAIQERLSEIEANPQLLEARAEVNFEKHFSLDSAEADWLIFSDWEQVKRFIKCCPLKALLGVFQRFSQDNRHTRSGFPDLVVWNADTVDFSVIEIKGPGDTLSTKQKLNLDFFVRNEVRAVVCNVKAGKAVD